MCGRHHYSLGSTAIYIITIVGVAMTADLIHRGEPMGSSARMSNVETRCSYMMLVQIEHGGSVGWLDEDDDRADHTIADNDVAGVGLLHFIAHLTFLVSQAEWQNIM